MLAALGSARGAWKQAPFKTAANPSCLIAAAGDTMLDRGVALALHERGEGWAFSGAGEILRLADIAFVNLETSVSYRGSRMPGKGIWFRTSPERLPLLKEAGIDMVSAANNHIMDYGEVSLLDTLSHLDEAGIMHVGAGKDLKAARLGRIFQIKGLKVGFLAYSDFWDIFWTPEYRRTFAASADEPGMAPAIRAFMEEDIRRLKLLSNFVVVSVHWGDEYMTMPNAKQVERAHAAIDAGADVVLGHHPHVLQPFEAYKSGIVFYSLGNFVFDQKKPRTTESIIALIRLEKGRPPEAEVVPMRITDSRPAPMGRADGSELLHRLSDGSALLGTDLYVYEGRGYLSAGSMKPSMLLERMHPHAFKATR